VGYYILNYHINRYRIACFKLDICVLEKTEAKHLVYFDKFIVLFSSFVG